MFEVLFLLFAGHFVCDLVFQGEAMGEGKNHRKQMHAVHGRNFPPWPYWLTAHASIHGAAVLLITGSLVLALVETALHAVIDFSKCDGRINVHVDQALHLICKIGYCYYLFQPF
jgi:hypothetical protein